VRSEVWVALGLAGVSIVVHALMPRELSRELVAVVLGALGGVYLGGALRGGSRMDIVVTAIGALACVGLGTAGLRGPVWVTGAGVPAPRGVGLDSSCHAEGDGGEVVAAVLRDL